MKLKRAESVLAAALLLGNGLILHLASSSSSSSQDHLNHLNHTLRGPLWPTNTSRSFRMQRQMAGSMLQSLSGVQHQSQHLIRTIHGALQGSHRRASNGASGKQFRGICLWDCQPTTTTTDLAQQAAGWAPKQNTTQLLLYTKANTGDQPQATLSRYNSPADLKHQGNFNPRAPTYLMVHGFRGSGVLRQPWFVEAKDLILNKGSANVFFADWSHHARTLSYTHALEHIPVIANDIYFIMRSYEQAFSSAAKFKMTKMKVVGHSLGAHIAGLLGQLMQGELEEITASDPAGFLINDLDPQLRLSHHDAKFVLAIHTNAQYFGTIMNVADRDVFYEDGTNQAACQHEKLMPSICNHKQATKFVSTYSGRCIQMAYKCLDHLAFAAGRCGFCRPDSEDCIAVGHSWQYNFGDDEQLDLRPPDFKETGKLPGAIARNDTRYFLKSGPKPPYCAYHFQVVAWFSDSSDMDGLESFELRLMANATSGGATRIKMSRHNAASQLEVFDDAGEQDTVSSRHLYTGLALIRTTHILYRLMPIKFARAILLDDIRDRAMGLKVHVNFMSDPRLSERAAYSGPVEASFAQIRHISEASTSDLRAAASSQHQTPYKSDGNLKRRHSQNTFLGF